VEPGVADIDHASLLKLLEDDFDQLADDLYQDRSFLLLYLAVAVTR
jgi:hypothetical protein